LITDAVINSDLDRMEVLRKLITDDDPSFKKHIRPIKINIYSVLKASAIRKVNIPASRRNQEIGRTGKIFILYAIPAITACFSPIS